MIKGLTLQLNEAGKIKIGKKGSMITSQQGKEFRPPEKLDHFQITTTEKDSNGDYVIDTALEAKIKTAGTGLMNEAGELIGIPIRLLYNNTELNFPTKLASYVSGKLSCTGDGETATKRVDDFTKPYPCPCPRFEQGYDGKDKCKAMGTLCCIIDEAGLFGQAHKFRTTSINSVKGILGGLELIRTATNGRIAGLPLMLTINPKTTTTPQGQATVVYVVSVCYRGNMSDLRHDVLNLISEERQYLIGLENLEAEAIRTINNPFGEAEQEEIAEEFYPDSIDIQQVQKEQVQEDTLKPVNVPVNGSASLMQPDPGITATRQPEPQAGPETAEPSEPNTDLPGASPTGTYKEIYDRLCEETEYEKAVALVKRLMKNNLVYWLTQNHPEIIIPEGAKKPELIELCEEALACLVGEVSCLPPDQINWETHPDYLRISSIPIENREEFLNAVSAFFRPVPIDRTQPRYMLLKQVTQELTRQAMLTVQHQEKTDSSTVQPDLKQVQQEQIVKQEQVENPPEKVPVAETKMPPEITAEPPALTPTVHLKSWDDDSGLIEREQLKKIVRLKKDMEMLGIVDPTKPETWSKYVATYLDAEGKPHESATKLSKNQGTALIEELETIISVTENIPF